MNKPIFIASSVVLVALLLLLSVSTLSCDRKQDEPAATPSQVKTVYANARCPIMGTTIDPANVPETLVREHKGQKVAFCCSGCPVAWDKLTEPEKAAKLANAK